MVQAVQTDNAPAAIGPYSQATISGNLVFVSGQIPLDPDTGKLIQDDIQSQTRQVLDNITAILDAAGSSMDRVIKCEVFLDNMSNFASVNEIYGSYFPGDVRPARQVVEAARLPKNVGVEISCIAELA